MRSMKPLHLTSHFKKTGTLQLFNGVIWQYQRIPKGFFYDAGKKYGSLKMTHEESSERVCRLGGQSQMGEGVIIDSLTRMRIWATSRWVVTGNQQPR